MYVLVDGCRSAEPPTNSGSELGDLLDHLARSARASPPRPSARPRAPRRAPPRRSRRLRAGVRTVAPAPARSSARRRSASSSPGAPLDLLGPRREQPRHLVGDVEVLVLGQPEVPLGRLDLVLAERRAVRLGAVLLLGRAEADVRAGDDQRRAAPSRAARPRSPLRRRPCRARPRSGCATRRRRTASPRPRRTPGRSTPRS